MAGAIARVGDMTSGHGPYPPNFLGGSGHSTTVTVEGKPAALLGGGTVLPCMAPNNPDRNGIIQEGSPTVTADGKAVARIGDSLTCGCMIVGGGNTVGGGANG